MLGFMGAGGAVGPVLGGYIADLFGLRLTYLSTGMLVLAEIVLFCIYDAEPKTEGAVILSYLSDANKQCKVQCVHCTLHCFIFAIEADRKRSRNRIGGELPDI